MAASSSSLGTAWNAARSWKIANGTALAAYTRTSPARVVEQRERVEQEVERYRAGDRGKHLGGEERAQRRCFADELEARERVRGRGGDGDGDDGGGQRDDERVAELATEEPSLAGIGGADDDAEVVERRRGRARESRAASASSSRGESAMETTHKTG